MADSRPGVLYVSAVPDFKGGAEIVLRNMLANPAVRAVLAVPAPGPLSSAAAAMGVTVCCYHPSGMMHVHRPLRARAVLAAVMDALRCARRLRTLARRHGCTILHSNGLKPHILTAMIGLTGGVRTLVHLHDIPYQRVERLLWRVVARCVTRVIMVSRPCFPGPVLPANVSVVPNGIAMVQPCLPPSRAAGPLRLGFAGRFHPNKGMDLLLDWFGAVREAGIDATLTIRGRPDPDMPEYWAGIQRRIQADGLAPWVHYEGWTTGAATYAGLDLLLMTSNVPDPAPLVVPEAMSAGVIVAGYPAGGIPDMIEHGRTGLLVTDGAALVQALRTLLAEPDGMRRVQAAAYGRVARVFDMAAFHERLSAIYAGMAPQHAPASGKLAAEHLGTAT